MAEQLIAKLPSPAHARLARTSCSPRRHLRRSRNQLLGIFGSRRARRVVPLRQRRNGNACRTARTDGALLAWVSAGRQTGATVRLPRAWTVDARPGVLVQSGQAAARSVRQSDRRSHGTGTKRCSRTTLALPRRRATISTARPFMPKSVVINPFFDWGQDRRPRTPWHRTVVYETHVKGFTKTHPQIPEPLRGTYAGMAHPESIKYLQRLGRDGGRTVAGAPVRAGLDAARSRAVATTGATTQSAISRRTTSTRAGSVASRCRSSSTSSKPARGRYRSHPRRCLQPHRGRQPSRAGSLVEGARQLRRTTVSSPTSAATTSTTPAPATR